MRTPAILSFGLLILASSHKRRKQGFKSRVKVLSRVPELGTKRQSGHKRTPRAQMIDDGSSRSGVGLSSFSGKNARPRSTLAKKDESLFQVIWQVENGNQDWNEREKIE
jgi:hypothetical protein